MAKDRNSISNQIDPYQTANKTFTFYPNIKPASTYKFGALIEGKVKAWLTDTDEHVTVNHNLDLKDIVFIKNYLDNYLIKQVSFPGFNSTKIFGNPGDNPKYAGLSIVTKIQIVRYEKDTFGKARKYPWFIKIENGYGEKIPNKTGGFYMNEKSYVVEKKASVNMSDNDFLYLVSQVSSYVDAYRNYVSTIYLPKWISEQDEFKKNGFKSNKTSYPDNAGYNGNAYYNYNNVVPTVPDANDKEADADITPVKKYKINISINPNEKFVIDEGDTWKTKVNVKDRQMFLYFHSRPSQEVINFRDSGKEAAVSISKSDDKVWFESFL